MKYCIAIDVGKGKSTIGVFRENKECLILPPKEINHNKTEMDSFIAQINFIEIKNVTIIMESTSTYHLPLLNFFKQMNYEVIVLNPLISKEHKTNLRKTKTDKIDCINLADIFFKGIYNKQNSHNELHMEMQYISRHIFSLQESLIRFKNRFKQILEMTFPEITKCFKVNALFTETALKFIIEYPHAEIVVKKRIDALANFLAEIHQRHPNHYAKKALQIKEAAKNSLFSVKRDSHVSEEVIELAQLILNLQNKINAQKLKLIFLAEKCKNFRFVSSMQGLSEYSAALLEAELKDITRFQNVKQLTASCGLDPTIIQSGKSVNYRGPISKRGNRWARKILFNCVVSIIKVSSKTNLGNPILVYYRKKRNEGKHHYAAVIASTTKLLRIIFTIAKKQIYYDNSL